MRFPSLPGCWSAVFVCLAIPAVVARPYHVLINHVGSTDPATEGWRRVVVRNQGTVSEKPIAADPVGNLPAWSIDDDGTGAAPIALNYQLSPGFSDAGNMTRGGWRYVLHLRVVEGASTPNFSICGEVATLVRRYMIRFTSDETGDTVVALGLKGPVLTARVPGNGYHRFVMDYTPTPDGSGMVSVSVDDTPEPLLADHPGEVAANVAPRIVWGSNQSSTAGHGHYHLVEFAMEKKPVGEVPLPPAYVAVDNVCAWPNLTVLPDGDILATIYGLPSHGGGEGDAQCWASRDQGKTWALRGVPGPHEAGTCRMNLAAGLARNGDVVVLCSGWDKQKMERPRHERILKSFVSRSTDQGATWHVSTAFPKEEGMSEFIPFGDIIQALDGTLCASGYAQTPGSKDYTYHSYFLRSTDDGRTWQRHSVIAEKHNETAIYQLPDGTWLAAARVNHMDIYTSTDNGDTWEQIASTTQAQHPGHFLRLNDGRLLLTHGDRRAGLEGVAVRISGDPANLWPSSSIPVARALNTDCGYPSSVQLPDGRVMTAFYAKGSPTHANYHMGVVFWDVDELLAKYGLTP